MSEENKFPCTDCEDAAKCKRSAKYLYCYKWREWFSEEWEQIQKIFGKDVSNRHKKKGSDLNE